MATKTGQIAEGIIKAIKAGNFSPIYLLYGEDSYSINQMIEFMENSILTEDEREFNQTIQLMM